MADCLQSCWCVLETQKCTQFQGGVKRRRGRLLLCSLALRDPEGAIYLIQRAPYLGCAEHGLRRCGQRP